MPASSTSSRIVGSISSGSSRRHGPAGGGDGLQVDQQRLALGIINAGSIYHAIAGAANISLEDAWWWRTAYRPSRLLGHFKEPGTKVVVDLTELDYISSAGLRVLLMAAKRTRMGSGKLAFYGLKEHIREVFEISGFLDILPICGSRDEALALVG